MNVHATIREKLRLAEGKDTTPDMLFTLEAVNCLGSCGLAPAMVINDEVFGQLTPERAGEILDDIIRKEGWNEPDDDRA
jgi:NADH-quinone oxidoreductase subunit E